MPDLSEKYLALNLSFPNRAGKLLQVVTTQKRVIEKLLRKPGLCDDTKQLIQLAAEGYIVTIDLLNYMKETLQDVANDSEVLREGSNIREIMKVQAQELSRFYSDGDTVKELRSLLKQLREKIQ